jgi:desulfoferrodoxin (superoxide reductase-like protein)
MHPKGLLINFNIANRRVGHVVVGFSPHITEPQHYVKWRLKHATTLDGG